MPIVSERIEVVQPQANDRFYIRVAFQDSRARIYRQSFKAESRKAVEDRLAVLRAKTNEELKSQELAVLLDRVAAGADILGFTFEFADEASLRTRITEAIAASDADLIEDQARKTALEDSQVTRGG